MFLSLVSKNVSYVCVPCVQYVCPMCPMCVSILSHTYVPCVLRVFHFYLICVSLVYNVRHSCSICVSLVSIVSNVFSLVPMSVSIGYNTCVPFRKMCLSCVQCVCDVCPMWLLMINVCVSLLSNVCVLCVNCVSLVSNVYVLCVQCVCNLRPICVCPLCPMCVSFASHVCVLYSISVSLSHSVQRPLLRFSNTNISMWAQISRRWHTAQCGQCYPRFAHSRNSVRLKLCCSGPHLYVTDWLLLPHHFTFNFPAVNSWPRIPEALPLPPIPRSTFSQPSHHNTELSCPPLPAGH